MIVVIAQLAGVVTFAIGTFLLGVWLRRTPTSALAATTSRTSHFLYWFCLVLPGMIGLFDPGLTGYDKIFGISPLPYRFIFFPLGALLFVGGFYLAIVSKRALAQLGDGAPAFKLTKQLVAGSCYVLVRNPMSLGYYFIVLGLALMAGSTLLTFGALFVLIPVHVFNLKFFEELEMEIRFGDHFRQYKETVPFLIPRRLLKN